MSTSNTSEQAHLTTETLAQRYGVSVDTARGWLRGKRPKFGYIKLGKEKQVPLIEVARVEAANLIHGQASHVITDGKLLEIAEAILKLLRSHD